MIKPDDTAYVAQDPSYPPGATIGDVLDAALAPLHDAVRRLEELAARLDEKSAQEEEYADALAWAELHDAWRAADPTHSRP